MFVYGDIAALQFGISKAESGVSPAHHRSLCRTKSESTRFDGWMNSVTSVTRKKKKKKEFVYKVKKKKNEIIFSPIAKQKWLSLNTTRTSPKKMQRHGAFFFSWFLLYGSNVLYSQISFLSVMLAAITLSRFQDNMYIIFCSELVGRSTEGNENVKLAFLHAIATTTKTSTSIFIIIFFLHKTTWG